MTIAERLFTQLTIVAILNSFEQTPGTVEIHPFSAFDNSAQFDMIGSLYACIVLRYA